VPLFIPPSSCGERKSKLDYFLTEQQKDIKKLARQIAEQKILPVRMELDEKEEFPWNIMKDLADADMFRVFVPEAYEGLGGGCLELCLVT
jgi:alkylation response protein AidB-like acyl-CoA dehydrogenase